MEDTLPRFFEHVPPDKTYISVRHLVEHTSGLRDIFGDDYEVVSKQWVIRKALSSRLRFKPGSRTKYSNCGYSLLGAMIEEVTEQPYEEYVYSEILKPAGVRRIGYMLPGWKGEELAVGYRRGHPWGTPLDHAWADDGPSWNLRANGGMLATAEELNRWFDGVLNGGVLSPVATKDYTDHSLRRYRSGKRVMGPAGGNDIFNAIYVNWFDDDVTFVLFTSESSMQAEDIFARIRPHLSALLSD